MQRKCEHASPTVKRREDRGLRSHLIPSGGGSHRQIAEGFVWIEAKIALATLCRRWRASARGQGTRTAVRSRHVAPVHGNAPILGRMTSATSNPPHSQPTYAAFLRFPLGDSANGPAPAYQRFPLANALMFLCICNIVSVEDLRTADHAQQVWAHSTQVGDYLYECM